LFGGQAKQAQMFKIQIIQTKKFRILIVEF